MFLNALNLKADSWISFQEKLCDSQIPRVEISKMLSMLDMSQSNLLRVRVWRNYTCEPMEIATKMVGAYWNFAYNFNYMGYDDSFSFAELSPNDRVYDVELMLVDSNHYQLHYQSLVEWLVSRSNYLGKVTSSHVVCVILGNQIDVLVEGKVVSSLRPDNEIDFYDIRYEKSTGSRLKPKTHYLLGRELAATWLPERSTPPKKLLAIDLDFTLHSGIVGEEGQRVEVTDQFRQLQSELREAKQKGLMLAVLSKNDRQDVLRLFREHPDYVLRESDFVSIEASWSSKSDAMHRVLEKTRINQDSVIFIDDNPVELIQMAAVFPGITCVSVDAGPAVARKALALVPGYRRSIEDHASGIRIRDLQSNEEREMLISNGLTTYYETARPVLKVSVGDHNDLERLIDLGKRSNQFNLLLARSEMVAYVALDSIWVALSLEDRFSDSGIIGGALCIKTSEDSCRVSELFLSCRVLGRGLETSLICSGLMEATKHFSADSLEISWIIGERNEPALSWISKELIGNQIDGEGSITLSIQELKELSHPPTGVKIEVTRRN